MRLLLALAIASIGCSVTGESILICHNANCAPGANVAGDDKLHAGLRLHFNAQLESVIAEAVDALHLERFDDIGLEFKII